MYETSVCALSVSDEFNKLQEDDKTYLKMLLKIDDYVARAFFTKTVVLVEGDTEDIVFREALGRLSKVGQRWIKSEFEVIKAREKGTIIRLVKYLKSLNVNLHVIHDKNGETGKAFEMNAHIRAAVGDDNKVTVLENCLEEVLGYAPPSSNKPLRAYKETLKWGPHWTDIPEKLQAVLAEAFSGYLPVIK